MMTKVNMIGGEAMVNVIAQSELVNVSGGLESDHRRYLLVQHGTFYAIYGFEFNGKRNVPHVGEEKYIRRLWETMYK